MDKECVCIIYILYIMEVMVIQGFDRMAWPKAGTRIDNKIAEAWPFPQTLRKAWRVVRDTALVPRICGLCVYTAMYHKQ